ncbi:LamG-like jellyroll fold domain-containing protein [Mangrovimonas aestuarii]|uniref:LamG-like jellyroll fold domain-containing protein n=1 Tax=Mangrovimonas aestuarii TaxID=3018443 RepID=UPI002378C0B7|nr:LamG-like jellyroll fold domain-containing protein [Mangrovimonas aestuarii]
MKKQLLSLKTLFCALSFMGLSANAQNGLNFDGTNDYVETTFPGIAGNGTRTVEAWVKTEYTSSQRFILSMGQISLGAGARFSLKSTGSSSPKFRIEIGGGGITGNTTLTSGTWHHVAVVYDNAATNQYTLYVDGNPDASGSIGTALNTPSGVNNMHIGSNAADTPETQNHFFKGNIDEVRVWNVARTQAEIQASMNEEICESTSGLVAYYKLNEGTAGVDNTGITTATDLVDGNDGTLSGFGLISGNTSNWVTGKDGLTAFSIDNTVSSDDTTLTANQTGATYQWVDVDNANAPIADETNQTFTPSASGNYAVEITMGGCVETSETIAFTAQDPIETGISLNFDGVDDYVSTPFAGVLGSNDRTFEAWVYVPSTNAPTSNMAIVDYGINTSGGRNTFTVNADNGRLAFVAGGTNGVMVSAENVVPTDTWTHVTFVLNSGVGSFYVNGVSVSLDTSNSNWSSNLSGVNTPSGNENVIIGKRVIGSSDQNLFYGNIDEVRIWNVARTETELQADMNSELCASPAGLVAYYKLNEGTVDSDNAGVLIANDAAGTNNGTLNGFALTTGSTSNWTNGAGLTAVAIIDATVSSDDTTLTANQTDATYQWVDVDNANAPIPGETNQTFTPSVNGNFAVEITLGACTETSQTVNFTTLGLNDNVFANSIRLYPNPTSNLINVNLGDTYTTVNASLLSVNGRVVAQKTVSNTSAFQMDLNQAAGLYFLNITTDNDKTAILKVVKK